MPENDPTVAGDARSENQQTAPFGRPLHRSPTAPELVARLHPKDRFLASVWFHYSIAGNLRGAGRRVQSIISINHEHIITPDCYHLILFEGDSKPALVHIDELDLCLPPLL